jgi:hypothetical protein
MAGNLSRPYLINPRVRDAPKDASSLRVDGETGRTMEDRISSRGLGWHEGQARFAVDACAGSYEIGSNISPLFVARIP